MWTFKIHSEAVLVTLVQMALITQPGNRPQKWLLKDTDDGR